jgi:hypothetical protein
LSRTNEGHGQQKKKGVPHRFSFDCVRLKVAQAAIARAGSIIAVVKKTCEPREMSGVVAI